MTRLLGSQKPFFVVVSTVLFFICIQVLNLLFIYFLFFHLLFLKVKFIQLKGLTYAKHNANDPVKHNTKHSIKTDSIRKI